MVSLVEDTHGVLTVLGTDEIFLRGEAFTEVSRVPRHACEMYCSGFGEDA